MNKEPEEFELKELPESTRKVMRENAYLLVQNLIVEKIPFSMLLWEEDNWNHILPDGAVNSEGQIFLDIKNQTLEDSYISKNKNIVISTYFGNIKFTKTIQFEDIIGVFNELGDPMIINNFLPEDRSISLNDLVKSLVNVGISEDKVNKSLEAFGVGEE